MESLHRWCGGWTAAVLVFLHLPLVLLVAYSFNRSRLNIVWEGFTFRWYAELWQHGPLLRALENSLIIALSTTVLSVALGTAGAWLLHRYRLPGGRWLALCITLPLAMPEILMGISLLIFFATAQWKLGFATVIVAHVTFCFPFVLVAVQARLAGMDRQLEEAALDLGATPARAFWRVIVPYLGPALAAGGLMAFTLSLDELIITYFTASPASATLPMKIFGMARVGMSPMLNAISTVFIVTTAALLLFNETLQRRRPVA